MWCAADICSQILSRSLNKEKFDADKVHIHVHDVHQYCHVSCQCHATLSNPTGMQQTIQANRRIALAKRDAKRMPPPPSTLGVQDLKRRRAAASIAAGVPLLDYQENPPP
eukprot:5831972-Amphidinium_carterae.1